jgi:hypothetical protein
MKGWTTGTPFLYTAKMNAVHSNDPNHENKRFWDATPGGNVQVTCIKENVFEVGREYYLDFIEAPPTPA